MGRDVLIRRFIIAAGALLVVFAAAAAGCGGGGGGTKIALLLPEKETPRYETNDKPDFEAAIDEHCEDCEVLYDNASGNAEKQQSQAEAALEKGAAVLVVDPVDAEAAAAIAKKSQAQGVPVVSYDRLIEDGKLDAYISFDSKEAGQLQAEALAERIKEDGDPRGPVIMINGDPTDPNAILYAYGANYGFKEFGVDVAKEYDTPGWSAEKAQGETQQAITALGDNGFAGVYAANDQTAGGAIAALKAAGIDPAKKPVTGQDATVAGLQRVLAGQQLMTVYKAIEPEANLAAEIAVLLSEGKPVPAGKITDRFNNGFTEIPSIMLKPIAVTKDNVKSTVLADGFVTASELCTDAYAAACKEAGISG